MLPLSATIDDDRPTRKSVLLPSLLESLSVVAAFATPTMATTVAASSLPIIHGLPSLLSRIRPPPTSADCLCATHHRHVYRHPSPVPTLPAPLRRHCCLATVVLASVPVDFLHYRQALFKAPGDQATARQGTRGRRRRAKEGRSQRR